MSLPPLTGHLEPRQRLAKAAQAGLLPQVILLTGPSGVGKQRLALWLAQLLFCERPSGEPCGRCRGCRLVSGVSHPDLHWFVPIPRPKASDPDKQVEEASEAIAQALEERRKQPFYGPVDGMAVHPMASVRLLQRRAMLTSVEGGWRVFIIGEADRLVPQESSPEAANALLKLLEEPPTNMLFVLTAADPRRMLPTIRSRAVTVRLNRLSDQDLRSFLVSQQPGSLGRLSPEALDDRVAMAEGSIGQAVAGGGEGGTAYEAARELLEAVVSGAGPTLERVLKQAPWSARGEFTAMLDALADTLSEAARGTVGQPMRRPVPQALMRHRSPEPLLKAMEHVADAREAAWGNVNPQILLAVLGEELAEVL
jgi:DNA polymerase III subunit delta'